MDEEHIVSEVEITCGVEKENENGSVNLVFHAKNMPPKSGFIMFQLMKQVLEKVAVFAFEQDDSISKIQPISAVEEKFSHTKH